MIDELQSWDIEGDQMKGESGVSRSITDELFYSVIEGDQMEGKSGVSQSIIDEPHSSDIK